MLVRMNVKDKYVTQYEDIAEQNVKLVTFYSRSYKLTFSADSAGVTVSKSYPKDIYEIYYVADDEEV